MTTRILAALVITIVLSSGVIFPSEKSILNEIALLGNIYGKKSDTELLIHFRDEFRGINVDQGEVENQALQQKINLVNGYLNKKQEEESKFTLHVVRSLLYFQCFKYVDYQKIEQNKKKELQNYTDQFQREYSKSSYIDACDEGLKPLDESVKFIFNNKNNFEYTEDSYHQNNILDSILQLNLKENFNLEVLTGKEGDGQNTDSQKKVLILRKKVGKKINGISKYITGANVSIAALALLVIGGGYRLYHYWPLKDTVMPDQQADSNVVRE